MQDNERYFIRITGAVGSGKSYIGEQLQKKLKKDVLICDIDEYYNKIIKSHGRDNIPTGERLVELTNKLLKKRINNSKAGIIIVIAVSTQMGGHNYFIKIDDIEGVYRRFLEREYEKINDNKRIIDDIIKRIKNPNDITRAIDENLILAPRYNFEEYKKVYRKLYDDAKSRKFFIGTQEEIYKDIITFCNIFFRRRSVSGAADAPHRSAREVKKIRAKGKKIGIY